MADVDCVLEIEALHECRKVVRIRVHVVAVPGLARPAVAAVIERDAAIAMRREVEHLVFKCIGVSGQPWLNTTGSLFPQSLK